MAWSDDGLMTQRGADTFEYDDLGRLEKATVSGIQGERIQQTFGYDLYGNRNMVKSLALAGSFPEEAVSYGLTIGANNQLPLKTVPCRREQSFGNKGHSSQSRRSLGRKRLL